MSSHALLRAPPGLEGISTTIKNQRHGVMHKENHAAHMDLHLNFPKPDLGTFRNLPGTFPNRLDERCRSYIGTFWNLAI